MPRPASPHPTDGELQILRILWQAQTPCSLGEIRSRLEQDRPVAATTVATMLKVMLEKKLVRRRRQAGRYVWSPVVSQSSAANGLIARLLDRVFDGSAKRMVAHLVESGRLTDAEREEIRVLLESTEEDA